MDRAPLEHSRRSASRSRSRSRHRHKDSKRERRDEDDHERKRSSHHHHHKHHKRDRSRSRSKSRSRSRSRSRDRRRHHRDDITEGRRERREGDAPQPAPHAFSSSSTAVPAAFYSERDAIARSDLAIHQYHHSQQVSAPSRGPALRPQAEAFRSSSSSSSSSSSLAAAPAPAPINAAPNFGLSGALAADVSSGIIGAGAGASSAAVGTLGGPAKALKWSEPAEARVPSWRWHLHCFKGDTMVDQPLYIHRQSSYLFGRDRSIADIPVDHPSCSSQHAVLCYRLVALPQEPGSMSPPKRTVKPYIIDLESTNGTFLNGRRVASSRYIELRAGDVIKFGSSSRDFVLLHDEMAGKAK